MADTVTDEEKAQAVFDRQKASISRINSDE
jgi:hypothetical protein